MRVTDKASLEEFSRRFRIITIIFSFGAMGLDRNRDGEPSADAPVGVSSSSMACVLEPWACTATEKRLDRRFPRLLISDTGSTLIEIKRNTGLLREEEA
jgi:hypothetical protein